MCWHPTDIKKYLHKAKSFFTDKNCVIPRGIILCEATNKIISSVCVVYERNLKISEQIFMKFGNKDISSRFLYALSSNLRMVKRKVICN
jgi:hypothetical protein